MFYFVMIPISVFLVFQIAQLWSIKKHDKVLYPICQIRRDIFKLLKSQEILMSDDNYKALTQLLETVDIVIHQYVPMKKTLFDLGKFLEQYQQVIKTKEFYKMMDSAPQNIDKEVQHLQERFVRAVFNGFFAYTPFIRSKFLRVDSMFSSFR